MRNISLKGLFCPKSLEFKQLLRTMKITLFLLMFVTFQAYCGNSYSQNAKVSIPHAQLRVGQVLARIESQTEYLFVYNKKSVDVRRTVNLNANNKAVSEVLDDMFEGTNIRYVMEGKNIVLTKNGESIEAVAGVQQNRTTVKGIVTDTKGEAIIGANVIEKGTTNGIITNLDGEFTIDAASNATLTISYIGYEPVTITLNGQTSLKIQMKEEALALETVVVTAMGIKRKSETLTYSVQQVNGEDMTRIKDANMINALEGKIAGVTINKNSSGLGGSAKVSIRGVRSAYEGGNNQPLYVIDGVPMLNGSAVQAVTAMGGDNDSGNRDSGDGISNINPEDIQSISVLKGASAAALYGSQAANGVIMITTKKGREGATQITFSTNTTFDKAISLPEYQNTYNTNWKAEEGGMKVYDNVGDFFSTGVTTINSLTLSTGNQKAQTYFSYSNTYGKGIIDSNKLNKHNITFRETGKFFNDKLTIDGNVNFIHQTMKNRPTSGGLYLNPLVGLYTFPRGTDMTPYKEGSVWDDIRQMPRQTWYKDVNDGMEGNPYWMKNYVTNNDTRIRTIAALSGALEVNEWFKIQARGTLDYISDRYEQQMWASTSPVLTGGDWDSKTDNGRYSYSNSDQLMAYADFMAMFTKSWNKVSLSAVAGASINHTKTNTLSMDSHLAGLHHPNVFTPTNINYSGMSARDGSGDFNNKTQTQSVFATAQLGYADALYLDVTARNDWSSTLYGTKSLDSGFFYPSVGLSWLLNKTFNLPQWVDFAKVRGSFAQVGNSLPAFQSNLYPTIGMGGGILQVTDYNDGNLKPEISDSWEVGAEFKLLKQRLDIDFTWYKTITKNQFLRVPMLPGSAYAYKMINAGKISNKGIELTIGAVPVQTDNFHWRTQFNIATNQNKVEELTEGFKTFTYGQDGLNMAYRMIVKEGGSLGDIYGNAFKRDAQGKVETDEKGLPVIINDRQQYLGNSNPDCTIGWSNTFRFYDFNVSFLIDARIGGDVMSFTQGFMDARGVSAHAGDAMDRGYIEVGGTRFEEKQIPGFFARVGDKDGCTEYYMYDATNIRLRELSVGYDLPQKHLQKIGFIKGLNLSLIARNLFFFYKDAPFDPDATMSVGNSNQGVDVFGMPTTRSIGFNVKFTF